MDLLKPDCSEAFTRAGAFTLARLLEHVDGTSSQSHATPIILFFLHKSLLEISTGEVYRGVLSVDEALDRLTLLLANTHPSPTLISTLLTPLILPLYSLLDYLDHVKTSDPRLKEAVKALLVTWFKIVPSGKAVEALWSILQSQKLYWEVTLEGNIRRIERLVV